MDEIRTVAFLVCRSSPATTMFRTESLAATGSSVEKRQPSSASQAACGETGDMTPSSSSKRAAVLKAVLECPTDGDGRTGGELRRCCAKGGVPSATATVGAETTADRGTAADTRSETPSLITDAVPPPCATPAIWTPAPLAGSVCWEALLSAVVREAATDARSSLSSLKAAGSDSCWARALSA